MKRFLLATAILAIAVAIFVALTLPPARLTLQHSTPDGTVAGIVHVHSNRSDGLSNVDAIAAAAARAGLKFVVFTDHGDATRVPDVPEYKSGVLCLDGVEISTTAGHYIAVDMPAAPYPLAGEPRDVVEDVRRLGGFGIAAHPNSPKPELRWRDRSLPVDGMETANLDTGWRFWAQQATSASTPPPGRGSSEWVARRRLAGALLVYPFRPAETIASLMGAAGMLHEWAGIAATRRVVSLPGADAHAKIALRGDPGDGGTSLPLPGYEASFRALSAHVTPERALTGEASADAKLLMRAIRAGHLYTAADGLATRPVFEVTATNNLGTVHQGDELGVDGPVTLRVRSNAPPQFTTIVWNGNRIVSTDHHEPELTLTLPPDPAAYWVEIRSTGHRTQATWISSNPIYVRSAYTRAVTPAQHAPASVRWPLVNGTSGAGWRLEHDSNSPAALDAPKTGAGTELRLRYGLAGGAAAGQFVALVWDTPNGTAPHDRLVLAARAEHPMRISVQLRVPGAEGEAGERWQRSIYLDAANRERTVSLDDLTPIGSTHTYQPRFSDVRSVLLVIDTTNTKPGAAGRVWITSAALER